VDGMAVVEANHRLRLLRCRCLLHWKKRNSCDSNMD
jgi:hypothetical protein